MASLGGLGMPTRRASFGPTSQSVPVAPRRVPTVGPDPSAGRSQVSPSGARVSGSIAVIVPLTMSQKLPAANRTSPRNVGDTGPITIVDSRSEEHTSELQSRQY